MWASDSTNGNNVPASPHKEGFNLDRAAAHFEDELAFCRKAGYRPDLAWTCHDYADALL